ncbi:MAG: glycosyltransferase family 39 protein [Verrucomicrobia bacterium]|nr:glycosyltransferase family 39 protein [Verrucomicrobiota bacterium]
MRRSRWTGVAVTLLLATYVILAVDAAWRLGPSFDEGQQLAVGYNLWRNGDYRIEGANGDFIKRWATLPYLWSRPNFPGREDPDWRQALPYELGRTFFFKSGNRPEALLRQGRSMVVVLGVATGLIVFLWGRRLFGDAGGLISLALFVFSPHMLAFGSMVSTDMSVTLLLLVSTWCVWRLLHRITWGWTLASLTVFGLLVLAKLSSLVMIPIALVLSGVRMATRRPLLIGGPGGVVVLRRRRGWAVVIVGMFGLHAVAGVAAIWAHYGFRYTASPEPADSGIMLRALTERDEVPWHFEATITWLRHTHLLPEGFRRGVHALLTTDDQLGSFMHGRWKLGGHRTFFPYAIWVKSSPSLLLLLAVGIGAWCVRGRRRAGPGAAPSLHVAAPLIVLVAVYLFVAVMEDINLGHRHILPIYPACYVLAGSAALLVSAWPGRLVAAGLLVWVAGDTLAIRPNYLAYFGAQAGGAGKGYTHLVDSSLDWGMNLPELKRWLDVHNPDGREPVFLAYFGTDDPECHGIKAHRLPGFFDWWRPQDRTPPRPGYYAISASLLQGVYTAAFGPWSNESERTYRTAVQNFETLRRTRPGSRERKELMARTSPKFWADEFFVLENLRFARLCAWLRHQGPPPHQVGHAILIWKLDAAALKAALLGPPVELTDAPLVLRRM